MHRFWYKSGCSSIDFVIIIVYNVLEEIKIWANLSKGRDAKLGI